MKKVSKLKKSVSAIIFAIIIIAFTFSACSKEYNREEAAQKLLTLCNETRANENLTELTINEKLNENAQERADEIAESGEFSHIRPDGSGCLTVIKTDYIYAGENLAKGDGNAENIFKEWMASTSHKENIMNGAYTQTGFGCAQKDGTVYWVQLFVG